MRKLFAGLVVLALAAIALPVHAASPDVRSSAPGDLHAVLIAGEGQALGNPAACASGPPCINLSWSNVSMAATVATGPTGVETTGPGVASVYECVGASSTCTTASLSTVGQAGSPWTLLPPPSGTTCAVGSAACTIPQTTSPGAYQTPQLAYGKTYNYAITNTWSGSLGGVASGYSSIFQLAMSAAPAASPATPSAPTGTVVAQ